MKATFINTATTHENFRELTADEMAKLHGGDAPITSEIKNIVLCTKDVPPLLCSLVSFVLNAVN